VERVAVNQARIKEWRRLTNLLVHDLLKDAAERLELGLSEGAAGRAIQDAAVAGFYHELIRSSATNRLLVTTMGEPTLELSREESTLLLLFLAESLL
jgi:hypothetical protein